MKPKPTSISFPEIVLLLLLVLVPILFSRVTQDCFEYPQAALLVTGALLLLGYGLEAELRRAARDGGGAYFAAVGPRLAAWAGRDPLGLCVLLFLGSAAASTIASPNPAQSLHGAPDSTAGFMTAAATAIVYFTSRLVSRGQARTFTRYARAAGFAGAVASGYALIQLLGLDPLVWGRTSTYEGDVRIFSTLGHPNMLGAYLAMTTPLCAWLALRARSTAERVVWALTATVSVIIIAATLSRGAWIGLGAGALTGLLLAALARRRGAPGPAPRGARRTSRVPAAALVTILVAAVAMLYFARTPMGSHLAERVRQLTSLSAPTTQSRIHIWRAGIRMARDHRWLGAGLDAFGTFFPRYRTAAYWQVEWGRTPNKAHNEGIQILATQGIVGAVTALGVILFAGLAIVRAVRRGEGAARSGAIAVGAALVAFVAQDLASFTVVALGSLAAALAGWVASAASAVAPEGREAVPRPRRPAPAWIRPVAAAPVAALFLALVALPIRAQVEEKRALLEPLGSPDRAYALSRAARYAPWDARYENMLSMSLLTEAGQTPNAGRGRELLREASRADSAAIAVEPTNGYYHSNEGRVATARALLRPPDATPEEVEAAFQNARSRDPFNPEIMDHVANSMIQLGRTGESRAIASRAATLYPDIGQPMGLLGFLALLDHRWADAADTLELAVRREWHDEKESLGAAWSNLSAAYLSLNRFADARRAAEMALELNPADKDARENRDLAIERLRGVPAR